MLLYELLHALLILSDILLPLASLDLLPSHHETDIPVVLVYCFNVQFYECHKISAIQLPSLDVLAPYSRGDLLPDPLQLFEELCS